MSLARHHLQSLLAVRPLDRLYAGTTMGSDSKVLIRQLLPGLPDDDGGRTAELFGRHMECLSRLTHPGTLPVREYAGAERGPFYYVTDVPVGITIAELVSAAGSLDASTVAGIALCVAERLAHAHDGGVFHLSVAPEQVLVSPDGAVTLLDLGLVPLLLERVNGRLRNVHQAWDFLFPTPGAVAPELLASEEVGSATDVYGLGILMHVMSCAVLPYSGSSVVAYNAILSGTHDTDPRRHYDEVPESLALLIQECLSRDPAARPELTDVIARLMPLGLPITEALDGYLPVVAPRKWTERFEPILRVVDGGRGRSNLEPLSPAVVPLFSQDEPILTEAELLAAMSFEQRAIYMAGARAPSGGRTKTAQVRRGVALGILVAVVALMLALPNLTAWFGTSSQPLGSPAVSGPSGPPPLTEVPLRRHSETEHRATERSSIVLYR